VPNYLRAMKVMNWGTGQVGEGKNTPEPPYAFTVCVNGFSLVS